MAETKRKVLPEINSGAKWLIVGEAPGAEEEEVGRPFVGKSGKLLDGTLGKVGLLRKQFNIANVYPYRPPNNDIEAISAEELAAGALELQTFIKDTKPDGLLTLGNTSLTALTGKAGIYARRGSVYEFEGIPLLPTLHPAAVLRNPKAVPLLLHDLDRFRKLVNGELPAPPVRRLITNPTAEQLAELRDRIARSPVTAVDIEALRKTLSCVGFAPTPDYAVCIPWGKGEEWEEEIRQLLAMPFRKVFHNSPFDMAFLTHRMELDVLGVVEDTLAMAQALHPELPRDLATLTSLHTLQPYYKDMAPKWDTKDPRELEELYVYNCLDVSVTVEIFHALRQKLLEYKLLPVYEKTRSVLPHALAMSVRGVRYDTERAEVLKVKTKQRIRRWQAVLDGRVGHPVNAFSSKQVKELLYKELKLPVKRGKGKDAAVTTGEKALNELYTTVKDRRVRKIIRAILRVREYRKFESSYLNGGPSDDGRVRTSFNPMGTETGRWSASKFLIVEGANLQTVPAEWKCCFIADEGMLLWNADYSQIEARIVAYEAEEEKQIAIFEDPKGDIHKFNAAQIFQKPIHEIVDKERQVGKSSHAINYDVSPPTLRDHVNKSGDKTGVYINLDQARRIRDAYRANFPKVPRWQERTWETVKRTHALTNHFGRRRVFLGPTVIRSPLDVAGVEHTRKEALAFVPQSDVPDLMNEALIELRTKPPCHGFEVMLNVHDALVGQGPVDTQHIWVPAIVKAMERAIPIKGRQAKMPVEVKVGTRWNEMKKVWPKK